MQVDDHDALLTTTYGLLEIERADMMALMMRGVSHGDTRDH